MVQVEQPSEDTTPPRSIRAYANPNDQWNPNNNLERNYCISRHQLDKPRVEIRNLSKK